MSKNKKQKTVQADDDSLIEDILDVQGSPEKKPVRGRGRPRKATTKVTKTKATKKVAIKAKEEIIDVESDDFEPVKKRPEKKATTKKTVKRKKQAEESEEEEKPKRRKKTKDEEDYTDEKATSRKTKSSKKAPAKAKAQVEDKTEENEWDDIQWEEGEMEGEEDVQVAGDEAGVINVVVNKALVAEPEKKKTNSSTRESKDQKQMRLDYQKTYLLSLIGHGRYLSEICEDDMVRGMLLSLVPEDLISEFKTIESEDEFTEKLVKFFKWFNKTIPEVAEEKVIDLSNYKPRLVPRADLIFATKEMKGTPKQRTLLLVSLLRGLDFFARVVWKFRTRLVVPKSEAERKAAVTETKSKTKKEATEESPTKRRKLEGGAEEKKGTKATPKTNPDQPEEFFDMWVEVYSPFKKKWEIVNLSDASFAQNGLQFLSDHKNNNTGEKGRKKSAKSSTEVCPFVLAFDGRMVVDVSPRYNSKWSEVLNARKEFEEIFSETIKKITPKKFLKLERIKCELEEFESMKNSEPLPTTVTPYKTHHLYCMKQFLGKFQVIYPTDTQPVSVLKGQEIYYRKNVFDVHTSERWLQHGKQIKEGEIPVKELPKRKRPEFKRKRSSSSINVAESAELEDEDVFGDGDSNPDGKHQEMRTIQSR